MLTAHGTVPARTKVARPRHSNAPLARLAVSKAAPTVRPAVGGPQGGDKRGVDCKLGTTPQRQAIGDDLNASVVLACWLDGQVRDKHVERDRYASFSAHTSSGTLERASPGPQNAGRRQGGRHEDRGERRHRAEVSGRGKRSLRRGMARKSSDLFEFNVKNVTCDWTGEKCQTKMQELYGLGRILCKMFSRCELQHRLQLANFKGERDPVSERGKRWG